MASGPSELILRPPPNSMVSTVDRVRATTGAGTTMRSNDDRLSRRVMRVCLTPVVALSHEAAPDLVDHRRKSEAATPLGAAVEELGDLLEGVHIFDDLLAD